jgi:type II secretory pathway predicted ATPase ExeA
LKRRSPALSASAPNAASTIDPTHKKETSMQRPSPTLSASAPNAASTIQAAAPPTSFSFPYRDYVAAKATFEESVRRGPFYGVLDGRSGTGKTSLVRDLEAALDRHRYQIFYWSASKVSSLGLTRHIAQALRAPPRRSIPETQRHIVEALKAQPCHLIVWIDEAHRIPSDVIEELRIVAEFDHRAPQLMSVVFSGPLELRPLLDTSALFALKRRITASCTLQGLRRDELDAFLVHRFGHADTKRVGAGHRDELFERTQGTVGILDSVVRHALARAKAHIGDEQLREAFDAIGI